MFEAAEVAHDRRQRGGHDGLVEGGEQQAQQQGADRDQHAARNALAAPCVLCRAVRVQGHGDLPGLGCASSIVIGVTAYGLSSPAGM
ncbi:hypothetical protein GCM10017687_23570 [Streptomyces echinatus]